MPGLNLWLSGATSIISITSGWFWVLWAVLLMLQNASFTLSSRSRNSGSLGYHAIASVLSNSLWFISQLVLVSTFMEIFKSADLVLGLIVGVFYVACTMTGSIGMHFISMKYIEHGTRRVGARGV